MSAPRTTVTSRESQAASSASVDTGTAFFAGFAERGSDTEAVLIRNLDQYIDKFGDRETGYTVLYDAVDVFFREGGSRAYISRVFGPNPTKASVNITDGTVNTLTATAKYPGAWGADIDVVVITAGVTAGSFILSILDGTDEVERSPELVDKAAAIAWVADSDYITLTDLGVGVDPAAGTYSLTGGTDDKSNATDATWEAALNRFSRELGPGQVAMPGRTSAQAHADLLEHAELRNRFALLDLADTDVEATLVSAVATDRALPTARYGAAFAPWAVVPGVAAGTTRTVPYSAVQAGLIARSDAAAGNPNLAVAGDNGRSAYAIGLSQAEWTDAERDTLHDGGVNVARLINGAVTTYGYRTVVDPVTKPAFLQASAAREFMALAADGQAVLDRFVFAQIDGKRQKLGHLAGDLIGVCLDHYNDDALFGMTPDEAFAVDVGEQVNTPATLAAGELRAVISARVSPHAEQVTLELVKVANTEALV